MDLDDYLTCPYDAYHRILKTRMAKHLVKCAKNHPNVKLQQCPYNSLHKIKSLEFEHHLSVCEDKANAMKAIYNLEVRRPLDLITVEEVNNIKVPEPTEDWSNDPEPVQSYLSQMNIQNRDILVPLMCASKAKKKEYKLSERERHAVLELERPLRLPRQPVQTLTINKMTTNGTDTMPEKKNEEGIKKNIPKNPNNNERPKQQSKLQDDDFITFTKQSLQINNNSNLKDVNTSNVSSLPNGNGSSNTSLKTDTNFVSEGVRRTNNAKCGIGRGIFRTYMEFKKCGLSQEDIRSYFINPQTDLESLMKKNTGNHDYTGTFFGYGEEDSSFDLHDIENEISNIDGLIIDLKSRKS